MSFQAKRLRVQLPCGEATVMEEGAQEAGAAGLCRIPSLCRFPTQCQFPTECFFCTLGTPCLDTYGCHRFFSCIEFESGVCQAGSVCGALASLCAIPTDCGDSRIFGCPAGSEQPVDPGTIIVDPEHLPALREALEAQLKEIEKAEQALKERGGQGEG
jgi:hypothetical protein